ncbi:MAG: ATP phosphoribosyltransferase [Gammaproteobacteria bacterium]|nr:MAG: ATP phosphoribosyltransferase [Gammaproteobacteria bacterium]
MDHSLIIAISKGRIFQETLPILERANIQPTEDPEKSRLLIIPTNQKNIKLLIVRATDVPTYVQHGAADLGIAGYDVVQEHGGLGIYQLTDLQIAKCRLMVAGFDKSILKSKDKLKIATKYVNQTLEYFQSKNQLVEIIKLYGSMELAPLIGLADLIVDVVDTGKTLSANGLKPLEHICDISSSLIVNRASLKLKHKIIKQTFGALL